MKQFDRSQPSRRFRMAIALAVGLVPILTMKGGIAQDKPSMPLSVSDDWTSRHVIFSGARSASQAEKMAREPRYRQQWLLHNRPLSLGVTTPGVEGFAVPGIGGVQYLVPGLDSLLAGLLNARKPKPPKPTSGFEQDWGSSLLAGGTVGVGMFPAKFTFDVTATPSCTADYAAFNTGLVGGAGKASQIGTFTASSLTGSVVVNGTTLTASPGTAASQNTTISANGVAGGNTITITNSPSSLTLTASAPVAEVDRVAFDATLADNNSFVTIAGIQYTLKTADWSGTVTSGQCFIRASATQALVVSELAAAITNGSANGGTSSTGTWQCGASATQPSNGVTVTGSVSPNVDVTAKIAGSTGFTATESTGAGNNNRLTVSVTTAGSDGSSTSPNFQYWSGAAAVPAPTLATNIINAIGASAAVGVGATSGGSGIVKITASATGLAGNGINVATTISSGLAASAFNGNLAGGASGTTAGTTFSTSTDSTTTSVNVAAEAAALAGRINANVATVTATSGSGSVYVTAVTAGTAGNSIGTTETFASGFTWGGTTFTGGLAAPVPTIVAFNQLYATQSATLQGFCGGSGPSVHWAYAVGTGAAVTSPVLSLDGTKIMFVATKASGAVLQILQWKATAEGTLAAPATPTTVTSWGSCAPGASCVVSIPFNGNRAATNSSPFYDYSNDALYVGDNNGVLHKFSPVLTGTPAEVSGSGWPLAVNVAGTILSSPVLDPGSSRVFLGDSTGRVSYVVNPTSGTASVGGFVSLTGSIVDSPIVDSSVGKVFVFNGTDTTNNGSVYQFSTSLGSQLTVDVGGATAPGSLMYAGTFDHKYLTSAGGTGFLFVCGKTGNDHPALHRIAITNGTMGADSGSPLDLTDSSGDACSPVTEFYNSTTGLDWVFFSVGDESAQQTGTCPSSGCLMSLNVTGTAWPPAAVTAAYRTPDAATGSTSGIIVDNAGGSTTVPSTSLSAAIVSTSSTSFTVGSTTGFLAKDYIQIDSEIMQISTVTNATTFAVVAGRGLLGTTAATHLINTAVTDLRVTLLNGAINNSVTSISVDSTTTFNTGDYIQIESEVMLVGAGKTSTSLPVTRARLGSAAAAHADNLQVSDLSAFPQAASIYFSFTGNAATVGCNGSTTVGCAVKLTQNGLQ